MLPRNARESQNDAATVHYSRNVPGAGLRVVCHGGVPA